MRKVISSILLLAGSLSLSACSQSAPLEGEFADKVDLLWQQVQVGWEDPDVPPAGDAGYAVFFSVSDGTKKASVRSARGRTLEEAWGKAAGKAASLPALSFSPNISQCHKGEHKRI